MGRAGGRNVGLKARSAVAGRSSSGRLVIHMSSHAPQCRAAGSRCVLPRSSSSPSRASPRSRARRRSRLEGGGVACRGRPGLEFGCIACPIASVRQYSNTVLSSQVPPLLNSVPTPHVTVA